MNFIQIGHAKASIIRMKVGCIEQMITQMPYKKPLREVAMKGFY